MFDPVLEAIRRATEVNMQMQQELMRRWIAEWLGATLSNSTSSGIERFRRFQKQWTEMIKGMITQQQISMQEQFRTGMKQLEETFRLAESAELEELRAKSMELWRKSFGYLRDAQESQLRNMQNAMNKWADLAAKCVT